MAHDLLGGVGNQQRKHRSMSGSDMFHEERQSRLRGEAMIRVILYRGFQEDLANNIMWICGGVGGIASGRRKSQVHGT